MTSMSTGIRAGSSPPWAQAWYTCGPCLEASHGSHTAEACSCGRCQAMPVWKGLNQPRGHHGLTSIMSYSHMSFPLCSPTTRKLCICISVKQLTSQIVILQQTALLTWTVLCIFQYNGKLQLAVGTSVVAIYPRPAGLSMALMGELEPPEWGHSSHCTQIIGAGRMATQTSQRGMNPQSGTAPSNGRSGIQPQNYSRQLERQKANCSRIPGPGSKDYGMHQSNHYPSLEKKPPRSEAREWSSNGSPVSWDRSSSVSAEQRREQVQILAPIISQMALSPTVCALPHNYCWILALPKRFVPSHCIRVSLSLHTLVVDADWTFSRLQSVCGIVLLLCQLWVNVVVDVFWK